MPTPPLISDKGEMTDWDEGPQRSARQTGCNRRAAATSRSDAGGRARTSHRVPDHIRFPLGHRPTGDRLDRKRRVTS
jgi:hypothetical protein